MDTLEIVKKILFLIVLVFILLFLLTWSNIIKCGNIPKWCDVYWGIMGPPKILIAYGDDGLGNPDKLMEIFENRDILGVRTTQRKITYLTSGILNKYNLVIVTRAKTMTADQLQMFIDYVDNGGRLVWTGDAGTGKLDNEKNPEDFNIKDESGGWIRINENNQVVDFTKIISAEYIGNFCDIVNCSSQNATAGQLIHFEDSIISKELPQRSELKGNFAIVRNINNFATKLDLVLDYRSNLITKSEKNTFQDKFPILIVSGLGDSVIYSAVPLEYFVDLDNYKDNSGMFYPIIIENIYENMIRGRAP